MEKLYTISSAKRLDFVDNYGNVSDSVYFEGERESVLWKHQPQQDTSKGVQVYGMIENAPSKAGGTYRKFKKLNPNNTPQGHSEAAGGVQGQKTSSYTSDGAKQGMVINNAAQYVMSMLKGERLNPQEFAAEVAEYAHELYKLDITKETSDDTDQTKDVLDFMSDPEV